ncbi:MAG: hypothetical protein U0Y08_05990 [Bacteroidia bacterium]
MFHRLTVMLLLVISTGPLHAQPGMVIDSLMMEKAEFSASEPVAFTVLLSSRHRNRPDVVRMVQTMSCSCNNRDFYYIVYKVEGPATAAYHRKVYLNHTERNDAEKCACKTQYANFRHQQRSAIPPIKENGYYMIEIPGHDFTMYSAVFYVSGE